MQFILDHQTLLAGLTVAVFDLAFALNPSWASNGVLHWVYVAIKKDKAGPTANG